MVIAVFDHRQRPERAGCSQRATARARGIIAAALALFALCRIAASAEGEGNSSVSVEVVPATLELPVDGRAGKVVVVVRAKGKERVRDLRLSSWTYAGVKVVPEKTVPMDLAPNADVAWTIELSRISSGVLPGTVQFQVNYNQQTDPPGGSTSPHVMFTALEVKSPQVETLEPLADVQTQSSLEALTEQTPGRVYVVITNKANIPLEATVTPVLPDFVSMDQSQGAVLNTQLSARQTGIVEIPILAKSRVQSGKHLLVFDVKLAWNEGSERHEKHMIVNREVTVGILGESAMLTLLGVPILLFLPGFLILRTYKLLWTLGFLKSKYDTCAFPLNETADFVLVAILISLVVLLASVGLRWDYLGTYGLRDITWLYLVSVLGLGAGLYILWMAIRWWWVNLRFPSGEDTPLDVLKKLGRQGKSVDLDRFDVGTAQAHRYVFDLEPPGSTRETAWVGPAIHVQFRPVAQGLTQDDLDALDRKINMLLEPGRKIEDLCDYLEKNMGKPIPMIGADKREAIELHWKQTGLITAPMEKNRTELTARRSKTWIVDFRTPRPDDDPITILKKLGRQELGIYLPRLNTGDAAAPNQVFLLQPWSPERETTWVGPKIQITLSPPGPNLDQAALDQIRVEIGAMLNAQPGQADLLARTLEDALRRSAVTLTWRALPIVSRPEERNTADLVPFFGASQKEWIAELLVP
jgi:hypothetical protein